MHLLAHGALPPVATIPAPASEHAAALADIEEQKRSAQSRLTELHAKRLAAAEDPAAKLTAARADLARVQQQADLAAHELATDAIYDRECLARGDDLVARIPTRIGPIVIRAESEPEAYANQMAMAAHQRAAGRASDQKERATHERNVELSARDAIRRCVLSDLSHFDRAVTRYPALWGPLSRAHNAINSGRVVAEGKDGGL